MSKHLESFTLLNFKTIEYGTVVELAYAVSIKGDAACSKALIDEIRTRNGNLKVSLSYSEQKAIY